MSERGRVLQYDGARMLEIRKSEERGRGTLDWLDARFTFSFGPYTDPGQVGFSDLRLLNDDRVKGGGGFATHEHKDTEVFSYVLSGALEHKDSMGEGSVVPAGDVIMMSAGTGIAHSEFNHSASEPVHFLQVWVAPTRTGVTPRYRQAHFSAARKRGRFVRVLVPDGEEAAGELSWYADARVYAALLDGDEQAHVDLAPGRYAYVHVIRGSVAVNGAPFDAGDGARVRGERRLMFTDARDAEVLVFDLAPKETPDG
jgi:redox-sensitive bicupin YhaK (pirin superfamily)